jgi:hypothetical protein
MTILPIFGEVGRLSALNQCYDHYFWQFCQFSWKKYKTIATGFSECYHFKPFHWIENSRANILWKNAFLALVSNPGLPDFSWYNLPTGEKCTRLPHYIRNGHNTYQIDQMSIKYNNIFHCNALQNFTQIAIFVLNIYPAKSRKIFI